MNEKKNTSIDLERWMENQNLTQFYGERFKREGIDGLILAELDEMDLEILDIQQCHKQTFLVLIEQAKNQQKEQKSRQHQQLQETHPKKKSLQLNNIPTSSFNSQGDPVLPLSAPSRSRSYSRSSSNLYKSVLKNVARKTVSTPSLNQTSTIAMENLLVTRVTEWTEKNVAQYVTELGYGLYAKPFLKHAIDGEVFIELEELDLTRIGIPLIHMAQFLTAIKIVRENNQKIQHAVIKFVKNRCAHYRRLDVFDSYENFRKIVDCLFDGEEENKHDDDDLRYDKEQECKATSATFVTHMDKKVHLIDDETSFDMMRIEALWTAVHRDRPFQIVLLLISGIME